MLLYELLTGSTPFDRDRCRKAAFDEIRRIIREEEPPKPSTRLSKLRNSERGIRNEARSSNPHSEFRVPNLKELDWIVMKCLEKDRNRRYDTVVALAKDVQRFLAGDAVEACPPSLGYRVRKFWRRNRVAILVALLFAVTLKATTLFSIWQASRAFTAETIAEQRRDEAERNAERAEANAKEAKENLEKAATNYGLFRGAAWAVDEER